VKIHTVTGETIKLSRWSGCSLNYVMQCGNDWVADVSLVDGAVAGNNRHTRVFVSQNAGVKHLMGLAHSRGELVIKPV